MTTNFIDFVNNGTSKEMIVHPAPPTNHPILLGLNVPTGYHYEDFSNNSIPWTGDIFSFCEVLLRKGADFSKARYVQLLEGKTYVYLEGTESGTTTSVFTWILPSEMRLNDLLQMESNIFKCNDLLQASEDHSIGIINNNIIYYWGFSSGYTERREQINLIPYINNISSHTRGFYNGVYSYSIKDDKWSKLGEISIKEPRQKSCYITLGNRLYSFGGFSYTPLSVEELNEFKNIMYLPQKKNISTYNDGIYLTYDNNKLVINTTKSLPYPLLGCGLVNYPKDKKIFFINGCIYDTLSFDTNYLINHIQIGKSFFYWRYDSNHNILDKTTYLQFDGTARFYTVTHILDDFIYVMSGLKTLEDTNNDKGYVQYTLANVLDNWKYDIINDTWYRISDFPIPYVNQSSIQYKNYIIFFGGIQFNTSVDNDKVIDTDKIYTSINFPYHGISTIKQANFDQASTHLASNLILVYNTITDKFYFSNITLPINISRPGITTDNEYVYIVGGELNPSLLNNIYYGNCSALMIKIKINDILYK